MVFNLRSLRLYFCHSIKYNSNCLKILFFHVNPSCFTVNTIMVYEYIIGHILNDFSHGLKYVKQ